MSTNARLGRRWRGSVVCAVSFWSIGLLVPVGAGGATVSVEPVSDSSDQARYVAASGELNRLTVRASTITIPVVPGPTATVVTAWTFGDPGAVIKPGNQCTAIDQHTVRCVPRPDALNPITGLHPLDVAVDLGDLDDEVSLSSTADSGGSPSIHGGPGDDRLTGGWLYGDEGDDVLTSSSGGGSLDGGPGNDRLVGAGGSDGLTGGGGADTLDGGDGADLLIDGDVDGAAGAAGPGPDVLIGGPGQDQVRYDTRSTAVRVDLASHAGGEAGEGDSLSSIESVIGGGGDDRLAGDDAANDFQGGSGRDRLIGRGGNDTLNAGGGWPPDQPRDAGSISCGPGRDNVPATATALGPPNALAADCEYVSPGYGVLHVFTASPRSANAQRLRYRLWCLPDEIDGEPFGTAPCSVRLRIRESTGRRRLLANGGLPQDSWANTPVEARLTRLGRRLAGRRHGVRVTVTLTLHSDKYEGPSTTTMRWIARLKIPR